MKKEYDFSSGARGRFYGVDATLVPPVHLDADVLAVLRAKAEADRVSLNDLVNALLRKDIETGKSA